MRRFNLIVLVVVTLLLWSTGESFADKGQPVQLTPVVDSPSPEASGTLWNVKYDWYVAYDEYGWPIGRFGTCGADFQVSGLEPNAWYNLRGIILTKTGYPWSFAFSSYDPVDGVVTTFKTDANGFFKGGCGAGELPKGERFDYFELWTGNYSGDDRTKMILVLESE